MAVMRLALDRDVLRAFLCPAEGLAEIEAIAEVVRTASMYVLPLVAEEIDDLPRDRLVRALSAIS